MDEKGVVRGSFIADEDVVVPAKGADTVEDPGITDPDRDPGFRGTIKGIFLPNVREVFQEVLVSFGIVVIGVPSAVTVSVSDTVTSIPLRVGSGRVQNLGVSEGIPVGSDVLLSRGFWY